MNKPPRIPPPPKGCYKSCQYDQQIMDMIGKYAVWASIAFGVAFGLASGIGMATGTQYLIQQLR